MCMQSLKSFLVLGVCGLVIGGCAATRSARNLSRETLAQVVEYEDSVHGLSRELKKYYNNELDKTSKSLKVFEETSLVTNL